MGGPDIVNLNSTAPPEIALGTFAHAGAIGGVRDTFVRSETAGLFISGVASGSGGYASFSGAGRGGVIWDGVLGINDANNDKNISVDELDFGLSLDLVNCPNPVIRARAFADIPGGVLTVLLATGATDYALYNIAISSVNVFADYERSILAPDSTVGSFDPNNVKAIAILQNDGTIRNLDVVVSALEIGCAPVPDAGATAGLLALGIGGLALMRRKISA